MAKLGRKPKPARDRRTKYVSLRVTSEQKREYRAAADREKMKLKDWARAMLDRAAGIA